MMKMPARGVTEKFVKMFSVLHLYRVDSEVTVFNQWSNKQLPVHGYDERG